MGKTRQSFRKRNSSKKRRTIRRRRASRRTSTVTKSTPAEYLINGARTLIGLLPGQAILKPISDFIFGKTSVSSLSYAELINGPLPAQVHCIGLQVCLALTPANLVIDSPENAIHNGTKWYSNYTKCCVRSISATLVSTCPTGKKSGMWGMCFQPLDVYPAVHNYMSYREICDSPFAKFGPVTSPLSLRFTPTPRTPVCYGMIGLSDQFIRLYVAFEDPQDGSDYTSEDFGCNVQLSGSVMLCCRTDSINQYTREITSTNEDLLYTSDGRLVSLSELADASVGHGFEELSVEASP